VHDPLAVNDRLPRHGLKALGDPKILYQGMRFGYKVYIVNGGIKPTESNEPLIHPELSTQTAEWKDEPVALVFGVDPNKKNKQSGQ
jgi:hypothetical protein